MLTPPSTFLIGIVGTEAMAQGHRHHVRTVTLETLLALGGR